MQKSFTSSSEQQTIQFGVELAQSMRPEIEQSGVLLLLEGELGAGKTQLVKGLAQGLGVQDPVLSPSYVYERVYDIPDAAQLVHIDAWRIETKQVFDSLQVENHLRSGNLVVIEWPRNYIEKLDSPIHLHKVTLKNEGSSLLIEIDS